MKSNLFTASALGAFLALSSAAGAGSSAPNLAQDAAPAKGRPMIGVMLADSGGSPGIDSVVPGGPAEAAGLKAGDVILYIGDVKTETLADLRGQLGGLAIGDKVWVTVQRGEETRKVSLSLADSNKLDLPQEPAGLVEVKPSKLLKAEKVAQKEGDAKAPKDKQVKQSWVIDTKDGDVNWKDVFQEGKDLHVSGLHRADGKDQPTEIIVGSGAGKPIKIKGQDSKVIKLGGKNGFQFEALGDGQKVILEVKEDDCDGGCCEEDEGAKDECCLIEECEEAEFFELKSHGGTGANTFFFDKGGKTGEMTFDVKISGDVHDAVIRHLKEAGLDKQVIERVVKSLKQSGVHGGHGTFDWKGLSDGHPPVRVETKVLRVGGGHPDVHQVIQGSPHSHGNEDHDVFIWKGSDQNGHPMIHEQHSDHGGAGRTFRWNSDPHAGHSAPHAGHQAPRFEFRERERVQDRRGNDGGEAEIRRIREELQALRAELKELRASLKRRRR